MNLNKIKDVNEKMINSVNNKQSKWKQILKVLSYFIPVILTWLVVTIFQSKSSESILDDESPEVFGERDQKNTQKVTKSDKLDQVLSAIKNDMK
jgi:hypothetical protein